MATYCFTTKDGTTVERDYPMGSAPKKVKLDDGRTAFRDVAQEIAGKRCHSSNCWPLHSDAMGVLPEQAKEEYEYSVKIGIPTEFDREGRAIFTSARHRKEYCEALGYYDRNGGYGDPQKGGSR